MSDSTLERDCKAHLSNLQRQGLKRELSERAENAALNFSSNDYLGLSQNPLVCAALGAVSHVGAGASRLAGGNFEIHEIFEKELSSYLGRESSLLFGAGYLSNIGVVSALVDRKDIVFSDKLIHASLIDGVTLSRAKHRRYRHNDINHLSEQIKRASDVRGSGQRFFIATESVFSMDGDCAPLADILALAEEFDATPIIDEAHAVGVFGAGGRGLAAGLNFSGVVLGTLSKSFGTYGGFASLSQGLREFLLSSARPFIYNTALPPPLVAASRSSLGIMNSTPGLGQTLLKRAAYFREQLQRRDVSVQHSESQIVPIRIGDASRAVLASSRLREAGIFVTAMRPPTVEPGTSRLRFSITLLQDESILEQTADTVARVLKELDS